MNEMIVLIAAVFAASQVLLYVYRQIAIRQHWLDIPNERSSHTAPTPGGAGLFLAIVFSTAAAYLWVSGKLSPEIVWLYVMPPIMALMGWIDDRFAVSRRIRAAVYLFCAILFVNGISDNNSFWVLLALAVFVFAFVNAFNFMDGIDGIAASQVLFYAVAFIVVCTGPLEMDLQSLLILLATISAAFLFWNWSPAWLFMGDSGSLFFGFLLAATAVYAAEISALSLLSSLILLASFIADSSVTLLSRLLNGERIQDAHRTHLYQLLARKWGSHARVVILYTAVNITVLLPVAVVSETHPSLAAILCIASYAVLCSIVWVYRTRLLSSLIEEINSP
ncbi:MAG: glycosyltransferase family 4 protein [Pseudomonadales bacterium]